FAEGKAARPPGAPWAVALIPLAELVEIALLGVKMRKTQRAYRKKRDQGSHVNASAEARELNDAELRYYAALRDVLNRERVSIPGMEGGDRAGGEISLLRLPPTFRSWVGGSRRAVGCLRLARARLADGKRPAPTVFADGGLEGVHVGNPQEIDPATGRTQ